MEVFYLIGATIFFFVYLFDKDVVKFKLDVYLDYGKCILLGSVVAIVINYILGRVPPLSDSLSFGSLLCVGWEDLVFSLLPIYYVRRIFSHRIAFISVLVASLLFGLGHIYQGYGWAIITCFYPFFVSYRIGKEHGYGTMMALHVTYDVSVFCVITILRILH